MVRPKLDMGYHKVFTTITLFVLLVVAIFFGSYVVAAAGASALGVATFGLVLVLFTLVVLMTSALLRMRDELHSMHEENRQQFHELHELVKKKK